MIFARLGLAAARLIALRRARDLPNIGNSSDSVVIRLLCSTSLFHLNFLIQRPRRNRPRRAQ